MFQLEFLTSTAAFQIPPNSGTDQIASEYKAAETARILSEIANALDKGKKDGVVVDAYANKIGTWKLL